MSSTAASQGDVSLGWLETLDDPELARLVAEAIERNQNIKVAATRLKSAREGTILARAARLPSATASASGNSSRASFLDALGERTEFFKNEDYRLALNLSWELDLWGRIANSHRATLADYEGELADYRGARLSLAANTAKAWCNLITARQQVELAEGTRESFQRNHRIVERNYKAGDLTASPLDVQFARNQVAGAERGLISQRLGRDEARRTLELLLGRYPAGAVGERDELPVLRAEVPAGLPSELLMRRPDLVAAAADLRASAERADAARKGLLPSINLSAGGSSSSPSLDLVDLIRDPAVIAWNVAASIAQPVYRGGALSAQARRALAINEGAVQTFSSLALRAFREVESALSAQRSLAEQHGFLETELAQANLAEAQALRDYSEGIVGILSVLEAQRRAFNARSAMIFLRNARLQNRIDLHLALGGDFGESTRRSGGFPDAESTGRLESRPSGRVDSRASAPAPDNFPAE